ncbi:MAG TPA: MlaD family protein [Capillimicrobium sp.]|nr:MlaD family protein [Capillimicrobium sp.]
MALLRRTSDPDAPRIPRKDRRGMSPVIAGLLVVAIIAVGVFFAFTKKVPFTHGFRVQAVFENSNSVRPNSPVRIAGVNVGKVTEVERYKDTDAALVTMELDDAALPIHKDATVKVRPRIFLEGNFFVDLKPGTPTAPIIDDGDTLPMTQTYAPVQIGDVLTTLQRDTREDLKTVLRVYGRALTKKPSAADDAQADPDTVGETAAQSLNDNFEYAGPAFRNTAIVNEAFLGIQPNDLGELIDNLAKITGALGRNERQLQDLVTNFNLTTQIFADESSNLSASIRELPPTLEITNRTLADFNAAFPPTRAFAREILPGVRESAATNEAAFPWIEQMRGLLQPSELQGVAREASPATRDLAVAARGTMTLLRQQSLAGRCFSKVILPTGDLVIDEGPLSTGKEVYKEFWYTLVGLAGESQNFDGNGQYVRFQPGAGSQTISTGEGSPSGEVLFGRSDLRPIGTRPVYPGKRPPYRPDVPCYTQKIPDLNGAATGRPDASSTETPPPFGSYNPSVGGLLGGLGALTGASTPSSSTAPTSTTRSAPADDDAASGAGDAQAASTSSASSTEPAEPAPPTDATATSSDPQGASGDVAAELLDRLNPFRAAGGEGR